MKLTQSKPDPLVTRCMAELGIERSAFGARAIITEIIAAAREEGMAEYWGKALADAKERGRAEGATVPCGACEGAGRVVPPLSGGGEAFLPCPGPGCVNGRVDARLAVVLRLADDIGVDGTATHKEIKTWGLAEFWAYSIPERKETP